MPRQRRIESVVLSAPDQSAHLYPEALRAALAEYAYRLGFDACRVTAPCAPAAEVEHQQQWLRDGNSAAMDYLARDPATRYDARSLLPACRSVIVLAMSYYSGDAGRAAPEPVRVARYAWGEDYHAVLRDNAEQLGRWLDERVPQHRYRVTVDSAPLAEKAFAVAAGVGWRGRNTLVLNERLGSYFMLACLLSSAELPLDEAAIDRCGSCQRCIESCPTYALGAPGMLDARRCISYWTTSSKQPPPRAEMLHGWLTGCDLCQQACPHNAAPAITREPRFAPLPGLPSMQPTDVLQMNEAAFQQRFGRTVLAGKGLARLQAIAKLLLSET